MLTALALATALGNFTHDDDTREAIARIQAVARHTVETEGVPGLAIAVFHEGEMLVAQGWGYGDAERRLVASADMLFPIATVGRQLTAAAILQLSEQHKLSLDDPLERWLPNAVKPGSGILLKHVLSGTSGIAGPGAWLKHKPEFLNESVKTDEFLAMFKDMPLEFAPGTNFSLDSSGYALLTAVVAQASGESYTDYVSQAVCEPLGLEHVMVCPPERRAIGYAGDCEHSAGEGEFDLPLAADAAGFGHHWCASIVELVRFTRGLLDRSLLEESSIRSMTTAFELSNGRATGHGYALAIETIEGLRAFSHTGGSGGFRVRTAHYVESDLTIAVLANCHGAAVESIEREVAAAILGWAPRVMAEIPLEAAELQRYCGTYQLDTTRVRIFAADGRLRFEGNEPGFALLYQGRHVFVSAADKSVSVKFQFENERTASFTLTRGGFESNARRME